MSAMDKDCNPSDHNEKKAGQEKIKKMPWQTPGPQGLYDPSFERDSCGVGFIVAIDGTRSHKIICDAQTMAIRMKHRAACDNNGSGDGAGVTISIPHEFYAKDMASKGVLLPKSGAYATGIIFSDRKTYIDTEHHFENLAKSLSLDVIAWRTVPTNRNVLGKGALDSEPLSRQVFLTYPYHYNEELFARQVFVLRKRTAHEVAKADRRFYICSLSNRIIVYKGMFTAEQLWLYYTDLTRPELEVYLAMIHVRYSTNTFPAWERAHPFRLIAHNGEINTLKANVNFMKAREGFMKSDIFGKDLKFLRPVLEPDLSDSGALDCALEFLTMAGQRSLPEAIITLIPEPWQNDKTMPQEKRDFYQWAACVMEPWDGPALVVFTDGRYIGALLDRNGLRPARYQLVNENIVVVSSEVGTYDTKISDITLKSRIVPGKMLLVDIDKQTLIQDEELKLDIANCRPHSEWIRNNITLDDFIQADIDTFGYFEDDTETFSYEEEKKRLDFKLSLFGYSTDCINTLFLPIFMDKQLPVGSMGHDSALIAFSEFQPLPYQYFKQIFAQVTNPPIDPFRENIVMSLECPIGPEANLLKPSAEQAHRLWLPSPVLKPNEMDVLRRTKHRGWKSKVLDITFPFVDGADGYINCLRKFYVLGEKAALGGYQLLIISDKDVGNGRVAISALLALGTLHKYLVDKRLRSKVALIVETAEASLVHHISVLLGYGADAICPYLAFNLGRFLRANGVLGPAATDKDVYQSYTTVIKKGIFIVMAKMGISTLQSYKCGQMFEILGLGDDVVERCFHGTPSRLGGISFHMLAKDVLDRSEITCGSISPDKRILRNSGRYHWRNGGEPHLNCPITIASLQDAAQNNNKIAYETFKESHIDSIRKCSLRGQLEINYGEAKVNICDVESARKIIRRFSSGSMSLGSISLEAHRTLTIGMNQIGARSNAGEGGELLEHTVAKDPKVNTRTSIKQVASARFGVTAASLASAEILQIKIGQGANPGEGSELPAYKVTEEIAAIRRSVPGVGSVSPPPHHDVYSIEDLSQLVYDLRCVNPKAKIAIKLVAEVGVGVVATGVVKGNIEHITICGHEGGTGAGYWTGIKSAGIPWELGVAEAHQALVLNNVRSRTILQAEGNMRTGFDIVVAALLGADEFGFGTIPLIAMGCTMMRKCHLNSCPVGIATQDPVLRKKFAGKPEHVINYFFMLAEDIRHIMANLGITKFQHLIGRTDLLKVRKNLTERAAALDLSLLLKNALDLRPGTNIIGGSEKVRLDMEKRLDNDIWPKIQPVINGTQDTITVAAQINNTDRTFGATISYHIALKFGEGGLPDGRSIHINLEGSAGQSFGAFLVKGVTITLKGEANDFVGKSLSGGTIIITTPDDINFESHLNVIAGNVCLYGASNGKAFFRGIVADRFCVRNTGATAVVEGVGDHGCEYMTGGLVIILGATGKNFAAGMIGGIVYVYDEEDKLAERINQETVHLVPLEDEEDVATVQTLLTEFAEKTGSVIAKNIIENWPEAQGKFTKVFPYEYERALSASKLELRKSKQYKKTLEDAIIDNSKHSIAVKDQPRHVEPIKEESETEHEPVVDIESTKVDVQETAEPSIKDIEDIIEYDEDFKVIDQVLDKRRGFIKYKREQFSYRKPSRRQKDWNEIYNFPHVRKNVMVQSARCMDCGVPFCQTSTYGCPLGNIIPTWTDLVFQSSWREALNQLLQTNNFPEFTGRVCPAPCEDACVLSISESPVTIRNIERSIIEHAFDNDWIKPEIPKQRTTKNIAIIGSGPAGLAAAHQLNKAGHFVTVYERNDRIGGLLQYGIPSMKLSKDIVKRRINLMRAEGIIFKTNTYVGREIEADCFLREYDAVLLAIGCTIPRDLQIPNRNLKGIHFAMEYLVAQQRQNSGGDPPVSICAKDKDVIIVGDFGLAGSDCMATALRQGAKSIICFEIFPQPPETRDKHNPWPQPPRVFKVDYGHEEVKSYFGQDPRQYSTATKEFVGEDGNVTGVGTIQVKWIEQHEDDWILEELPGTEKCYPADLVILSMGFVGPEKSIINELDLCLDDNGNIATVDDRYKTSFSKVFAAGDCRRGQSSVVWAIAEGREAAREIDSYLMGRPSGLPGPGGLFDPTKWLETIPKIPQNKMPKYTIKRKSKAITEKTDDIDND